VVITVPPDALSEYKTFSVDSAVNYTGDPLLIDVHPFDIRPHADTFAAPVSVTIRYSNTVLPEGVRESELRMYKYSDSGWQEVENSIIDTEENTVTASMTTFSTIQAGGTPAATVTVEPTAATVTEGSSVKLTAVVRNDIDSVMTDRAVIWSSSNVDIATVNDTGLVESNEPGIVTVTATTAIEGLKDSSIITVDSVAVASVAIDTVYDDTLLVNQTTQLHASAYDAVGNELERLITWTHFPADGSIATVSSSGLVTAESAGDATIRATSEDHDDAVVITVEEAPVRFVQVAPGDTTIGIDETAQLSATAMDAGLNQLDGRTITWSSDDPDIATVDPTSGLVTGVELGTVSIIATCEGQTGEATIDVDLAPVDTVVVTPSNVTVEELDTWVQLAAVARDSLGAEIRGVTFSWSSSATDVATVTQAGLAHAVGVGSATISATSNNTDESITGEAAFEVNQNLTVDSVIVTPDSDTLTATGATLSLSATAYSGGQETSDVNFTWVSSDVTVATVNANTGLATAVGHGATEIIVNVGTVADTADLTVDLSRAGFFVSPGGSPSGDGSIENPWDLATAFAHPSAVVPGSNSITVPDPINGGDIDATIIWLLGGEYGAGGTVYEPRLTGTSVNPIIVRQYPGERATIRGRLKLTQCPYTWWWGFEQIWLGSYASDVATGISSNAAGVRLINLVVHDNPENGVFMGESNTNGAIHGSLIYNNGIRTVMSTGHAHGIYTQNGSGHKVYSDNIIFNLNDFGAGGFHIHAYGESGDVRNVTFDGNVMFSKGSGFRMYRRSPPTDGIVITDNMVYQQNPNQIMFELWGDGLAGDLVFTGNYNYSYQFRIYDWESVTLRDNTFIRPYTIRYDYPGTSHPNYDWDNNTYFDLVGGSVTRPNYKVYLNGVEGSRWNPTQWNAATGNDANSAYTNNAAGKPTANQVFVRKNAYEPKRANIVVYNWQGASSVSVDVSSILDIGDDFEVRHVYDFFGTSVVEGTYSGGFISLPMAEVAPPEPVVGWQSAEPNPSTGREFHTFVLIGPSWESQP